MSELKTPPEAAPILGRRVLVWLGASLLLGLLLQTLLARIDRGQLEQLETFSETTAVGDRVYFPVPSPLPNPPLPVARVRGEALVPVSYEKFECRDTRMRPAARDAQTKLTIYRLREPAPGSDTAYFVKTAANEYLQLRPAK